MIPSARRQFNNLASDAASKASALRRGLKVDFVARDDTILFVSYIPTILVVGDPRLNSDLSLTLPQGSCRLVHCDSAQEALDQAANAAVVVINMRMAGVEGFARRLRADPITGSIPILVRGGTHQGAPWADEVLSANLQQTMNVLQTYLPELLDPNAYASSDEIEELDEDAFFDIDESTVIWRRPEGVEDWPQPPPEQQPNEDVLDYTRGYAGYVNSLVEAYLTPDHYTTAQHVRLDEMSHRVIGAMDATLNSVQNAINDALRDGNLQRMRELSAGKNILFEKLQQLRNTSRNQGGGKAAAPAHGATPPNNGIVNASVGASAPSSTPEPMTASAGSPSVELRLGDAVSADDPRNTGPHSPPSLEELGTTGPQRKSRLTIAAEAKERERAKVIAREAAARRAASSARSKPGDGGSLFSSRVFWLGLIALAVVCGGLAYVLTLQRGPTKRKRGSDNQPPVMQYVTIQEIATAVIARPKAKDPEGDRISYSIRWIVNGEPVEGARTMRLHKRHYAVGQSVVVEVTPSDRDGLGQPMASQPLSITGRALPTHNRRRDLNRGHGAKTPP